MFGEKFMWEKKIENFERNIGENFGENFKTKFQKLWGNCEIISDEYKEIFECGEVLN